MKRFSAGGEVTIIIRGTQPFWQDIAGGAILVAAVGFDQWRRPVRDSELGDNASPGTVAT